MKKKDPLLESLGLAVSGLTVAYFLVQIIKRIFVFMYFHLIYKNINPDEYDYPIDDDRSMKLRKIVGDDTMIVHSIPSAQYVNAFSDGTKHVFYTVPLENMCTERELLAVLIHEYGHYKEAHTSKYIMGEFLFSVVGEGIIIGALAVFMAAGFPIIIFQVLFQRMGIPAEIYEQLFSKKHEFIADSYAKKFGYQDGLISFLKKLEVEEKRKYCRLLDENKCNEKLQKMHKWSTHPSNKDRVEKLMTKLLKMLPFGPNAAKMKNAIRIMDGLAKKMKLDASKKGVI